MALAIFGGHCRLSKESIKDPVFSSESEDYDDNDYDESSSGTWILFLFSILISIFNSKFVFPTDDSSDDDTDDDIEELNEGLNDLELAEKFCHSPLPDDRKSKAGKQTKKNNQKALSEFHLDEWICLKMETNSAHQLFAMRQKWQVR